MSEEFVLRVKQLSPNMTNIHGAVKDFETVIQSKRRSSSIHNLEGLVMLLAKRDFIDPQEKSTWVNLNDLCTKYCGQPFCQTPTFTPHQPASSQEKQHSQLNGSDASTLLHPNGPIVTYLSSRILNSWMNFARGLKVPQGEIDDIEIKYRSLGHEACVRAVLANYERNLSWASPSNGDVIKDIQFALSLLRGDHFKDEFKRVIATMSNV